MAFKEIILLNLLLLGFSYIIPKQFIVIIGIIYMILLFYTYKDSRENERKFKVEITVLSFGIVSFVSFYLFYNPLFGLISIFYYLIQIGIYISDSKPVKEKNKEVKLSLAQSTNAEIEEKKMAQMINEQVKKEMMTIFESTYEIKQQITTELNDSREETKYLKEELKRMKFKSNQKINILASEKTELEKEIQNSIRHYENIKDEKNKLEERVRDKEKEIKIKEQNEDKTKRESQILKAAKQELNHIQQELKKQLKAERNEKQLFEKLNDQLLNKDKEVKKIQDELMNKNKEMEKSERKNAEFEYEISKLNKKNKKLQEQIKNSEKLQKQIKDNEKNQEEAAKNEAKYRKKINDIEKEYKELSKKNNVTQKELNDKEKEIKEYEMRAIKETTKKSKAKVENTKLQEKNKKLEKLIAEFRKKTEELDAYRKIEKKENQQIEDTIKRLNIGQRNVKGHNRLIIESLMENSPGIQKGLDGELELLKKLINYLPKNYSINVQPNIGEKNPDFLLIHPDHGFRILEVKNWSLSVIENINSNGNVTRKYGDNKSNNPLIQVAEHVEQFNRYLLSNHRKLGNQYDNIGMAVIHIGFTKDEFYQKFEKTINRWDHKTTKEYFKYHIFADEINHRVLDKKIKKAKKSNAKFEQIPREKINNISLSINPE